MNLGYCKLRTECYHRDDMESTLSASSAGQRPELTPQGGARLLILAREYIDRIIHGGLEPKPCPTVATAKGPFSPVLVEVLLREHAEIHASMVNGDPNLQVARSLNDILESLRSGQIPHPSALRAALIAQVMRPWRVNSAQAYFDLLYGALQLLILYRGSEQATQYAELFQLAVAQIYSLVSIESSGLSYQVEHFLAHAAIYISLSDSTDLWSEVVDRAQILMEEWGMAPPPEGVFTPCALNLGLNARRMPANDLPYDLVKHLRRRVSKKQMTDRDAFEVLTLTLGWRLASSLMRVLWSEVLEDYNRYEREVVTQAIAADRDQGWNLAEKRGFCSELGIPYVKTDRVLTKRSEFAISFPGGWTIGGTSVICKAGKLRILLDCGVTALASGGGNEPDLDLVDCILVSHAHQDHIGGLLELYREGQFAGPWYATRHTGTLGRLTLQDAVRLHKEAYGFKAIYDEVLLEKVMDRFVPVDYGIENSIGPEISVKAFPAGHVPGSCQWQVTNGDKKFIYSGDINLRDNLSDATRGFEFPSPEEVDSTIGMAVEGTYAFREERILENSQARDELLELIRRTGSAPVLIPVLSLGRAQEVCAALSGTELRVGVFGLASRMTRAVTRLLQDNIVFDERSPDTIRRGEYDVLVASSGCLQGGPSKIFYESPHLKGLPLILTGHIFPGTPAKAIMNQVPRVRFSAHAASSDLEKYMKRFAYARRFVIHLPAWPSRIPIENAIIPRRHCEYLVKG